MKKEYNVRIDIKNQKEKLIIEIDGYPELSGIALEIFSKSFPEFLEIFLNVCIDEGVPL